MFSRAKYRLNISWEPRRELKYTCTVEARKPGHLGVF